MVVVVVEVEFVVVVVVFNEFLDDVKDDFLIGFVSVVAALVSLFNASFASIQY